MAIATDRNQTWDYVLKSEKNLSDKNQTIFTLKPMTVALEDKVLDSHSFGEGDDGKMVTRVVTGKTSTMILENCLIGWKNLNRVDGTPINFNKDDFLQYLNREYRIEIATEVRGRFDIDEDTAKNLPSADVSEPDTLKD